MPKYFKSILQGTWRKWNSTQQTAKYEDNGTPVIHRPKIRFRRTHDVANPKFRRFFNGTLFADGIHSLATLLLRKMRLHPGDFNDSKKKQTREQARLTPRSARPLGDNYNVPSIRTWEIGTLPRKEAFNRVLELVLPHAPQLQDLENGLFGNCTPINLAQPFLRHQRWNFMQGGMELLDVSN